MNIESIVKLIMSLWTSHTTASKSSSEKAPSPSSQVSSPKLEEKDGYYIWQKGEAHKLSDHFSSKEMACRCSHLECKEQRISKDLIARLEKVRIEIGQPLIVTSAFRCHQKQEDIRASGTSTVVAKKSTHETGDAVDVVPKSGLTSDFEAICAKQFDSIGVAKNFLHLDTRQGKRRWNY